MRLILVRHGETEENKAGILQGHLPGKLSKIGIEQARGLALKLKNEKIDHIYSSDLARASDTAKEIAKYHNNVPIDFVTNLRERNIGEFQGKKKSDFGWDPKDFKVTSIQPKNGETIEQLFNRAENFVHEVIEKHPNDNVLFVGHNGINKAIMAVIACKKHGDIESIGNRPNTSIDIFEIAEDKNHKIHLLSSEEDNK